MNENEYDEVINGQAIFSKIAEELLKTGKCIIGWTDEEYDHRDILFTYCPKHLGGGLQRGLRWCYLYVSIIGYSCMGFLIEKNSNNKKDIGYLQEKLNLHDNHCDLKICELINGVINYIDGINS